MSKPYMDEYRSTNRAKMKHTGVQGEFPPDKAKRIAKGFADGGPVGQQQDAQVPRPNPAIAEGLKPVGPTGKERILPSGKVSGF